MNDTNNGPVTVEPFVTDEARLTSAQIRHLHAEAAKWEQDRQMRTGWRLALYIAGACLTFGLLAYGNWETIISMPLKNLAIKRENLELQIERKELRIKQLGEDLEREKANLLQEKSQLELMRKRTQDINDKYEQQLAEISKREESIEAERRQLQDTIEKLKAARSADAKELEANEGELRKLITQLQAAQAGSLNTQSVSNLIKRSDEHLASNTHKQSQLEQQNKELANIERNLAAPATPAIAVVVPPKATAPQREAVLTAEFENFYLGGVDDFVVAGRHADEWLDKQRKKLDIPTSEKLLAGVRKVFGESIVFTDNAIYAKEAFSKPTVMAYATLANSQISVEGGIGNIRIGDAGNLNLAGSSLKKSQLEDLLKRLQAVVIHQPGIFGVARSASNQANAGSAPQPGTSAK